MRPLVDVTIVDEAVPGAAPVSEHSVFGAVTLATRAEAVVLATLAKSPTTERRRISLVGRWERHVAREVATLDAPPPAGAEWHEVSVPDNYGLEADLSTHFGPVFYRRALPGLEAARRRVVFEAVDYLAAVWLDGRLLGRHEGYFAPFAFDVPAGLAPGSELVVGVQDPFEDLDPEEPFVRHGKRAIKGTLKYHDSRPGGLPGRHTPGWTAREGQSMTTGGITGDVFLVGTGAVSIDALFITPLDAVRGRIHVAVVLTASAEAEVELGVVVEDPSGEALGTTLGAELPRGASRIDFEATVPDPVLWWPRSHAALGAPAIYRFRAEVRIDGEPSDVATSRFGLRTARVEGDPKSLVVNERPVFVCAVNYIPRQHFADVDIDFYRRDMALCADAHVNSLGVHGHVQSRACYDAADEAGLLVFQDFALQWHYDAGSLTNPGFGDLASRQIAEMAYTLHDHPSVVYWACHNEPTALFVPGMKPDPSYDFDNQVLDEVLEARLREVEKHRHVHRASGIGDDLHLYDGSLNGGDVYGVRRHRTWFVSEYGFWTIGRQSGRWGESSWPPDQAQMQRWLSRLSFGPWTMNFAGLPERYGSESAWGRATEIYGAFLAKYQTEWIRMHRGAPFNAYRWHFFCDWWGWAGGGLVDVDRRPKATYRAFARASRPLLVCTSWPNTVVAPGETLDFPIHAVNDRLEETRVVVEWSWHERDRSVVVGVDEEVGRRYDLFNGGTPSSMVAVPEDGEEPSVPSTPALASGRFEATVAAESARLIGTVSVKAPTVPLRGATLHLSWNDRETGWFHVIAATPGWFPGPGAFDVTPRGAERLVR